MFRTGHATSRENISRFGAGWVVAKKSFKIRSSYSILGYLPTPLGHPGAKGRGDMGMGRPLSRTRLKNTKLFLLNVCLISAGCLQIVFGHKYSPSGAALPFWDKIVEIGLGGEIL